MLGALASRRSSTGFSTTALRSVPAFIPSGMPPHVSGRGSSRSTAMRASYACRALSMSLKPRVVVTQGSSPCFMTYLLTFRRRASHCLGFVSGGSNTEIFPQAQSRYMVMKPSSGTSLYGPRPSFSRNS